MVLPFDPVMPTTAARLCALRCAARACNASMVFATRTAPHPSGTGASRSIRKARTPRSRIASRKSCESWFAPRMAAKSGAAPSSQVSERLSVTTDSTTESMPVNVPPQMRAISDNKQFISIAVSPP